MLYSTNTCISFEKTADFFVSKTDDILSLISDSFASSFPFDEQKEWQASLFYFQNNFSQLSHVVRLTLCKAHSAWLHWLELYKCF